MKLPGLFAGLNDAAEIDDSWFFNIHSFLIVH